MTASLSPVLVFQAFDNNGDPLAGGKLYSYQAGTLIPQSTYTDATGTIPDTNPLILDGNGQHQLWLGSNPYDFNLVDAANVQQPNFPVGPVSSAATVTAINAAIAANNVLFEDDTSAANGAGMVGYGASLAYPAGTVGKALQGLPTQVATAFTTGGTAPAYTLTPVPAITVLATPTRYRVKFTSGGTPGSNTLNVSGLGPVALMEYDPSGILVAANISANLLSDVEYDGTYWVLLNPIRPAAAPNSSHSNLRGSTTGLSAAISVTANHVYEHVTTATGTDTGQGILRGPLSLSCSLTASGAGGLDNQAPQTCSISAASPAVVTLANHGYPAGAAVTFGGTVPTGISTGVAYRVINPTTNTFQVYREWAGTASFATNVMTIVSTTKGTPAIGQLVTAAGVLAGTTIVSGTGPWTLSTTPGTIGTEAATGTLTGTPINSSGSASSTATVASVLDSGAHYSVWAIYNPSTLTDSMVASSSQTNPVLPSGYVSKAMVWYIPTDSTASKYPLHANMCNDVTQFVVGATGNVQNLPSMASSGGLAVGNVDTPTWASIATGAFVPPNAAQIEVVISVTNGASSVAMVAPNNAYGTCSSTTNPPPLKVQIQATIASFTVSKWITLESSNIYWASVNGNNTVFTSGFRLNL